MVGFGLLALLAIATASPVPSPTVLIDDASQLDEARVAEIVAVSSDRREGEVQLRTVFARARAQHLPVSIAGARHTMGGHTIAAGGIVLDMTAVAGLSLDPVQRVLRAGAGAKWSQIVPFLNAHGLSPAVMQSNNDFTVGGSLSANCHGWQPDRGPIASTVRRFDLMRADGRVLQCSRTENRVLFDLVLGGYGLFGVILEAELEVVPNSPYRMRRTHIAPGAYADAFSRQVAGRDEVGMAYGRLSIAPETFMCQAILNVFEKVDTGVGVVAPLADDPLNWLKRALFFASIDSAAGKSVRWELERRIQPESGQGLVSRNQLLFESAKVYHNPDPRGTDLLHEYFVPHAAFADFVARVRTIVPWHKGNLLNVTVRDVKADHDSFLRYADQDMFALVMLFHQTRDPQAEAAMTDLTRDLVAAALSVGGRYYLPYRLHATLAQFHQAYPQASRFFALKRRYDPGELFQNQFYRHYGAVKSR